MVWYSWCVWFWNQSIHYIYICTYIYTYTCGTPIYIYIHIHVEVDGLWNLQRYFHFRRFFEIHKYRIPIANSLKDFDHYWVPNAAPGAWWGDPSNSRGFHQQKWRFGYGSKPWYLDGRYPELSLVTGCWFPPKMVLIAFDPSPILARIAWDLDNLNMGI